MSEREPVVVEFLGVPRFRTRVDEAHVASGTLREILKHLQQRFVGLSDLVGADGELAPWFRVALADGRLIADGDTVIPPGSRLLLLSADVGG